MTLIKKGNFYVFPSEKESSEARVTRFKKWFARSRLMQMVKEGRYRKGDESKREARTRALKREEYRAEREKKKYYQ